MRRRLLVGAATRTAAAVAGGVVVVAFGGGAAPAARRVAPRLATATVVRTTLADSVLTGGTLGYAPARPVVNQLAGTYTWLPAEGSTITAGQALYRVDDRPAVLMTGRTPAWRSFSAGMSSGPDVTELQANLIAEGYATGLLSAPSGYFDALTIAAVRRWQAAVGYPVTGQITLGQVVFLPTAIRVGAQQVAPGQPAGAGQRPLAPTTPRRVVTVPLNPDLPTVRVGQRVSIVLPSQATTPGRVVAIGQATGGSAARGSAAGGGPAAAAAEQLTVVPARPAATGTGSGIPVQVSLSVQSVRDVLAVPVSALLALAGGGYALEVVAPTGRHRLIGVRPGIFAAGQVQVSGAGITPGQRVVVAQ